MVDAATATGKKRDRAVRLSKTRVDAAQPGAGNTFLWDVELNGFGLRTTPAGTKSYVLQYRMGGREASARRLTIGKHGSPWTPDTARAEASRLLTLVRQGIDPADKARERRRQSVTLAFGDYADRFVDLYLKESWKDSWAEGKRILDVNVKPVWKNRALTTITRGDVAELLDGFVDRPGMKKATHSVIRKLFKWAAGRGDIASSPIVEMPSPSAVPARKRVLTSEELVCVWLAAEKMGYPWRGVFRLLIATVQRRREVSGLAWSELAQLKGKSPMWTLPPERAKNDEGHRVPLNTLALEELAALTGKRQGLLFTTTGKTPVSGFSDAKERLDGYSLEVMRDRARERGENPAKVQFPHWRIHDLRRTGVTMLQGLGVIIEHTEAVINHISGKTAGVAGVYNLYKYDSEKRRALDLWSDRRSQLISDVDPASNVVPLKRA